MDKKDSIKIAILFSLIIGILFFSTLKSVNGEIIINTINISVKKGIESSFSLNITNTYNFDIYQLQFINLNGFNFPSINISKSSNAIVPFTVKTNYSYDGTINSIIKFRYLANIPEDITTYDLTITSSGINGKAYNYLTARKGDTIRFINNDIVTHNIQSTTFEKSLAPGETFSTILNNNGMIDYQTVVAGITFYTGTIETIDRTGSYLVYNQIYDSTYTLYLNSISDPTNLSASISNSNYTIDPTGYKESLLTISNVGGIIAEKVHLSSDLSWISYDENDFDLSPSDTKYIKLRIQPQIFSTNQTNSTYYLNLKIKALNTNESNFILQVFVPYSNAFGDMTSEQGFITWFTNVYCPANPQSFLCNTSAINRNETARIIYKESEFSVNMTGSEWYNLVKRIGMMEDTMTRQANVQTSDTSGIKDDNTIIKNQTNETLNIVKDFIENQKATSEAYWIFGIILFICICITAIVYSIRKYTRKKEVVDVYDYHYK